MVKKLDESLVSLVVKEVTLSGRVQAGREGQKKWQAGWQKTLDDGVISRMGERVG